MNYIGSKSKLSSFLYTHFSDVVGKKIKNCVICDAFGGSGAVGKMLKEQRVERIISNDREYYSYVLNQNYVANSFDWREMSKRVEYLNALEGIEGKIFRRYCLGEERGECIFLMKMEKKLML